MIPNDALENRLRSEADTERPAFSADLHHQLMSQLRNQQNTNDQLPMTNPRTPRRTLAYAAALLLIASTTLAIAWHATRPTQPPTQPPAQLTSARPTVQPPFPPNTRLTLHIGDLLAAQLWPPRMTVSLPLPAPSPELQPSVAPEPTALPQWMISKIEAPPQAETRALLNVLPDDLKSLLHPFAARLLANSTTP